MERQSAHLPAAPRPGGRPHPRRGAQRGGSAAVGAHGRGGVPAQPDHGPEGISAPRGRAARREQARPGEDRKSTRLNSSHSQISYAVFCLKKKKKKKTVSD